MNNQAGRDRQEEYNFEEKYSLISDEQLMDILKNRLNYQHKAVECAIQEAIKRGLIKNARDLEKPHPELKFRLFPSQLKGVSSSGIWSSTLRILYILGIFPIVYGILAIAENNKQVALAGIISGTLWITFTYLINKQKRRVWAYLQIAIALLVAVGGFIYFDFFNREHSIMDYLVVMIVMTLAFLTPIYAAKSCSKI